MNHKNDDVDIYKMLNGFLERHEVICSTEILIEVANMNDADKMRRAEEVIWRRFGAEVLENAKTKRDELLLEARLNSLCRHGNQRLACPVPGCGRK